MDYGLALLAELNTGRAVLFLNWRSGRGGRHFFCRLRILDRFAYLKWADFVEDMVFRLQNITTEELLLVAGRCTNYYPSIKPTETCKGKL